MDYLTCIKRQPIVHMTQDGAVYLKQRCSHQSCESFGQDVTPETCEVCPLRMEIKKHCVETPVKQREFKQPRVTKDGHIIYPRTGWEPPKVPTGYVRKSTDLTHPDAWHFIPQWPLCKDRIHANAAKPCGCITIMPYCRSKESIKNGQLLILQDCINCPVQRPG